MDIKTPLTLEDAAKRLADDSKLYVKNLVDLTESLVKQVVESRSVIDQLPKTTSDLVEKAEHVEILEGPINLNGGPLRVEVILGNCYCKLPMGAPSVSLCNKTLENGDYRVIVAILKMPKG